MKKLIEKDNGLYRTCRIPGLIRTRRGTLLAYYECRRSLSDWADIDLKIIRSTDEGETWQTVRLLPGEGNTLNNPVMLEEGDTLHFLYCQNYRQLFACTSTDDGVTFTEPVEKTEAFEQAGFYNAAAIGPGHGIEHQGRLLVPAWFASNRAEALAHRPSVIRIMYSEDHGRNWQLTEPLGQNVLINPSECALAVTPKGRVVISIRHENPLRRRAWSLSDSGIRDWEPIRFAEELPDPICQGSMISNGQKVLHIHCASETQRVQLALQIGADCKVLVDEMGGYADIAASLQKAYVLYERNIGHDGLYFTKIDL